MRYILNFSIINIIQSYLNKNNFLCDINIYYCFFNVIKGFFTIIIDEERHKINDSAPINTENKHSTISFYSEYDILNYIHFFYQLKKGCNNTIKYNCYYILVFLHKLTYFLEDSFFRYFKRFYEDI